MTTIISLIALAALVAGLIGLIRYARHDLFGASSLHVYPHDELGPVRRHLA